MHFICSKAFLLLSLCYQSYVLSEFDLMRKLSIWRVKTDFCYNLLLICCSGSVRWSVKLEGRIECSATITGDFSEVAVTFELHPKKKKIDQFMKHSDSSCIYFVQVVVGCYKGKIYFLDISTGKISWTFQTDGEVLRPGYIYFSFFFP